MDSNIEMRESLPKETQDAIRAGLLEAEALDLEARARAKERTAEATWVSLSGHAALLKDAGYFREEAASKRAKAKRIRKAQVTT